MPKKFTTFLNVTIIIIIAYFILTSKGTPPKTDWRLLLLSIKNEQVGNILIKNIENDNQFEISDKKLISSFLKACRDIKSYHPNHPINIHRWIVTINGSFPYSKQEIKINFEKGRETIVTGYFIEIYGKQTKYYGSFQSKNLRTWFNTILTKKHNHPLVWDSRAWRG